MQTKIKSNTDKKEAKRFSFVPYSLVVSRWDAFLPIK